MTTIIYLACEQASLSYLGERSESRENAQDSAPRGFAARSGVLARLASLAQTGELARRLLSILLCPLSQKQWNKGRKFCVCLIVVGGVDCCSSMTTCCLMSVNFCNKIIRNGKSDNKSNYCYIYLWAICLFPFTLTVSEYYWNLKDALFNLV